MWPLLESRGGIKFVAKLVQDNITDLSGTLAGQLKGWAQLRPSFLHVFSGPDYVALQLVFGLLTCQFRATEDKDKSCQSS